MTEASSRRVTRAASLAALVILGSANQGSSETMRIGFDESPVGELPAGFATALTNGGEPGRWVVEEDATAPSGKRVLVQRSADPTRGRFPLCVLDGLSARDVAVAVRFKPLAGEVDQAAGIVWRYRDPDNYYIVRANAREGNIVLYKVESGKRTDLKPAGAGMLTYGKEVIVPSGQWSTLRVEARGSRFTVVFEGRHLFDVEDATFPNAGKVGLWTKADSVTAFDDFAIESLEPEQARP